MKAVVDTNVVAYCLLGKLRLAVRIGVQAMSIRAVWGGAFLRSLESGVAVYNCRPGAIAS